MKTPKSKQKKSSWFKHKSFLHFDFALPYTKAEKFVTDANAVAKHDFSPLIHYTRIFRQYKKNKNTGKAELKLKSRNIFYASHRDGYIYSYYSQEISKKYESFLKRSDLTSNILAYRFFKLPSGKGASNVDFAKEIFSLIGKNKECAVLCLDIKSFFDNINTQVLERNWARVCFNDKTVTLRHDHKRVFDSLANFTYVEEKDIKRYFDTEPRKRGRNTNRNKKELRLERNKSKHTRICCYSKLREANTNYDSRKKLIRSKTQLGITGIPQGTAISGLLSNIFLIDFDIEAKKAAKDKVGIYKRYSDDIVFILPLTTDLKGFEKQISDILFKVSGGQNAINPKKTERNFFKKQGNKLICLSEAGVKSKSQYLGFTFDGSRIEIRNSSISRNRAKISYLIRKFKKRKIKNTNKKAINTRAVYKAQSARKITPFQKKSGFTFYAKKAAEKLSSEIIKRQINKNDRFIAKKIKEEREK